MSMSVPLGEFTTKGLICLAADLRERFHDRSDITVNIFSSSNAASQSLYHQETSEDDLKTFAQMHARYNFSADKHEEYLEIMPSGVGPSLQARPESTRIDLPLLEAPHCRLEVANRCVIVLEYPTFPQESLTRRLSGTIVLSATVTTDGKFANVHVSGNDSFAELRVLANSAVRNLSIWRLEPYQHQQKVEIRYSFKIDDSLPRRGQTAIVWSLPKEITIRARPLE
jgi:TonB family protein